MKSFMILCLTLLLCGCTREPEPVPTAQPETIPAVTVVMEAPVVQEAAALEEAPPPPVSIILEAEAPGIAEQRTEKAVVDHSHTEDGYVMVQFLTPTEKRLKVQLKGPNTTYTYNLTPEQWAVLPLSDGNGSYKAVVYENVSGTRYATVMTASFAVTLRDEFAPFLRPNQYVNYFDSPNTMELSAQLCAGMEHPLKKVAAVYDYVVTNLRYDYEKASSVKSGYLPVLDQVLEEKKGICFDYAALMTAMLRSQNVPCKLVVGYAGKTYHAWISVWTEDNGWVDGAIFFDGHVWKRMDPTFASSQERSDEIMDFIENGNYRVKYLY